MSGVFEPEKKKRLSDAEKMHGLPWSIAANAFSTVFGLFTVFGSVFLLFLTELGISKYLIGLLLSLFPFCGLMAPFLSGYVEYFGSKRIYLFCIGFRKLFIALFLLFPWIGGHYGNKAVLSFLIVCIAIFAVLRAIGETALYAWIKEYIPDRIRGKYEVLNAVVSGGTGFLAILFARHLIGREGGLDRYMLLIAIGCIFGIVGVSFMRFVPGGEPSRDRKKPVLSFSEITEPLKNRNFLYFLAAVGSALFGSLLMVFLPLFMKDKVGIIQGNVVLLDNATIMGSFLVCFLWGWMSDRFGGRPVLMLNLCIYVCVASGWLIFSRHHPAAFMFAAGLYFLSGSSLTGRVVGDARFLYAGILPEEGAVYYTSLFYAWLGLVGGLAPLTAGYILKKFAELNIQCHGRVIDAYCIIFAMNLLCQLTALFIYRKVKPDKDITTRYVLLRMVRRAL